MSRLFPLALLAAATGCGGPPSSSTPPPSSPAAAAPDDSHSHERGKMLIADFGPYHALLTAHLSKSGHEMDIFVETADAEAKPVAISAEVLKASVQVRRAEGGVREVEFRPAPPDERPPGEAAGTCSHFVAKVPWLEPDTEHRVIVEAEVGGKKLTARWNSFVPRKYAHHED
jgi:hypothetical protein